MHKTLTNFTSIYHRSIKLHFKFQPFPISTTKSKIMGAENSTLNKKMNSTKSQASASLNFTLEQTIDVQDVIKIAEDAGDIILQIYEQALLLFYSFLILSNFQLESRSKLGCRVEIR